MITLMTIQTPPTAGETIPEHDRSRRQCAKRDENQAVDQTQHTIFSNLLERDEFKVNRHRAAACC
ncbi:hypothetical protein [Bradyrhizobium sp. 170]|uniref:hypothetical protein n=1 Tax=Bradyrhizobium sp. 170 TaxID=2782641 RepID=UPI001FFF59AF|nr:hypothetical protein [Bradyrhizobium sp. 170]UPK01034.1 hypothetical protein IVB05_25395 [Bradyrhizobium sp. 170]